MHPILARQIKKFLGDADPQTFPPAWISLLQAISETYRHYDEDKDLIERSLELSSKELSGINEKMRQENANTNAKAEDLEKINKLMIGRELKMLELKKEIERLNKELAAKG